MGCSTVRKPSAVNGFVIRKRAPASSAVLRMSSDDSEVTKPNFTFFGIGVWLLVSQACANSSFRRSCETPFSLPVLSIETNSALTASTAFRISEVRADVSGLPRLSLDSKDFRQDARYPPLPKTQAFLRCP